MVRRLQSPLKMIVSHFYKYSFWYNPREWIHNLHQKLTVRSWYLLRFAGWWRIMEITWVIWANLCNNRSHARITVNSLINDLGGVNSLQRIEDPLQRILMVKLFDLEHSRDRSRHKTKWAPTVNKGFIELTKNSWFTKWWSERGLWPSLLEGNWSKILKHRASIWILPLIESSK